MGLKAVQLLIQGVADRVVVYKKADIVDFDIVEALATKKNFDDDLAELADILTY